LAGEEALSYKRAEIICRLDLLCFSVRSGIPTMALGSNVPEVTVSSDMVIPASFSSSLRRGVETKT